MSEEREPSIKFTKGSNDSVPPILAILFRPFGFIAPKTLDYLAFQSFDVERT
jgi:hypothetical protein